MKLFLILFCTLVIVAPTTSEVAPNWGYVPNSEAAITIAEAVLIPVYGKKVIGSERPLRAALKNDVWTVEGTLYCPDGKPQTDKPPTCVGGVAVVKISRKDGRIISMTHYK